MLYFQLLVLFCFRTGKCLPDPALFRHCLSAVAHVWCRCLRLFLRRRGVVDGGAAPPVASHRIAALDNWPESQDPPISGSVSSSNQDQSANIRCELIWVVKKAKKKWVQFILISFCSSFDKKSLHLFSISCVYLFVDTTFNFAVWYLTIYIWYQVWARETKKIFLDCRMFLCVKGLGS